MLTGTVGVTNEEITEDRFSRYRLIRWWDQERIATAKVLVVGAGALGNEILKNLALLGFRKIVVMDPDRIELSNLSRSVLYRPEDIGSYKVDVAARSVRALYQDAVVQPIRGNVLFDAGLGLFGWADVILAGLDNREARLWINRCAWKMRRPWIDGAIEGLSGVARVFLPGQPPCYECTLGAVDWAILQRRMSCNLLTHQEMEAGKVATTPTTSSVIAGIQVQEALKYLHGQPVLAGKGFIFDGIGHNSYVVEYTENPDCQSHYYPERVIALAQRAGDLTLRELYARAVKDLGSGDVVVEFSRDIIWRLVCSECEEEFFVPLGALTAGQGQCPRHGQPREVRTVHSYTGTEPFGDRLLNELGLPVWDLFVARSGEREIGYLLAGDAPAVLGPLEGLR